MSNYNVVYSGEPEAHITKKKNRLKKYGYNRVVYLNDGDSFEIELFNPTSKRILTKIYLNGDLISLGGIVLNPGERIFLERYIDTNNSFVYNTYFVDNSKTAKEAIRNNGQVKIEFYVENFFYPIYESHSDSKMYVYTSDSTSCQLNDKVTDCKCKTVSSNEVNYCQENSCSNIETGYIEKGPKTNQEFQDSHSIFDINPTTLVFYYIKPLSNKIVDVKEIRNYCSKCGKKVKKQYNYCPSCGNKIK